MDVLPYFPAYPTIPEAMPAIVEMDKTITKTVKTFEVLVDSFVQFVCEGNFLSEWLEGVDIAYDHKRLFASIIAHTILAGDSTECIDCMKLPYDEGRIPKMTRKINKFEDLAEIYRRHRVNKDSAKWESLNVCKKVHQQLRATLSLRDQYWFVYTIHLEYESGWTPFHRYVDKLDQDRIKGLLGSTTEFGKLVSKLLTSEFDGVTPLELALRQVERLQGDNERCVKAKNIAEMIMLDLESIDGCLGIDKARFWHFVADCGLSTYKGIDRHFVGLKSFINGIDQNGQTPFHCLIGQLQKTSISYHDFLVSAIYFIEHGADIDIENTNGTTVRQTLQEIFLGDLVKRYDEQFDTDSEEEEEYEFGGYVTCDDPIPDAIQAEYDEMNARLGAKNYSAYPPFLIAHFRGEHVLPKTYKDRAARRTFFQTSHVKKPIYSSAAYDIQSRDDTIDLDAAARKAHRVILALRTQGVESEGYWTGKKGFKFKSYYYMHITRYVNSYQKYHKELKNAFEGDEEIPMYRGMGFKESPNVSTADHAILPFKYATGWKNVFSELDIVYPEYRANGRPKHANVGKIYTILHSPQALEDSGAAHIASLFSQGLAPIQSFGARNYMAGRETTFFGQVEGLHVASEIKIRYPNFSKPYRPSMLEKYGLTKEQYEMFAAQAKEGKLSTDHSDDLMEVISKHMNQVMLGHARYEARQLGRYLLFQGLKGDYVSELPQISEMREGYKAFKASRKLFEVPTNDDGQTVPT